MFYICYSFQSFTDVKGNCGYLLALAALGIAADTGPEPNACRRMSG